MSKNNTNNTASSQARPAKKKRGYAALGYTKKKGLWGFILLCPWLIGFLGFFLIPLVQTFYYALFDMKLANNGFSFDFIGIDNFRYIFTVDPDYNQELLAALRDMALNVPIQIFVALFLAIMLNAKFPGRGFFRTIFFIPIILSTGILTIEVTGLETFNLAAEETEGVMSAAFFTETLANSGIPAELLSTIQSFVSSIFEVITTAGVQILIFLSGLQGISPSLYEVAKLEGCTQFECFCKITLPMISPMILVCLVYSLSDTFAKAEISELIDTTMFTSAQYGRGAAMSAVYFTMSVGITLLLTLIVSKVVFYYDN